MDQKYSVSELGNRLRQNWPEAISPESEVVLGLIRLSDIMRNQSAEVSARFNLTPAAFDTLVTLRSLPEPRQLTPSELFRSVLITSGGMTKVLDQLETKGWITRTSQEGDKRSKLVRLTISGQALAEECLYAVMEGDRKLVRQSLTSKEVLILRNMLMSALDNLE